MANCARALAIDAVEHANSGHPGAPLGMADAATVLFRNHLKFDAAWPEWPDRDRFVLSNGHASALLYAMLYLTGYKAVTIEELRRFRQWGAITAGHPEFGHAPGVEITTGPLGQGLAGAVGMAMAERLLVQEFGNDLVSHHTYVFVGDGCLQEGVGQEAVSLAGHLGLGRLIVLYDDNGITIDGEASLSFSEDVMARFAACGWHVQQCDGHDHAAIDRAIRSATRETARPSIVAVKTTIGLGAPNKAGTASSHGAPLGEQELRLTKEALGWKASPFQIPQDLREQWLAAGRRGAAASAAWRRTFDEKPQALVDEFERRLAGRLPSDYDAAVGRAHAALLAQPQHVATRRASQMAIEALAPLLPELVGGSADLTGSNLTRVAAVDSPFTRGQAGRYVSYGVREFGMAGAMNGMAVHGGLMPYGGTFLVFSDYARSAIRLSALMGVGTIYVMTHDSIGLGEDGPTHQPVEHLASLRAMPNLHTFRPADAVETLECWDIAIRDRSTPSLLALSRQATPQLRLTPSTENLCAKGAYLLRQYGERRDVTLLATGTEVALAIDAAEDLSARGISAAIVSMPCWDLFERQSSAYREEVLGRAPRIAVEAASVFGWTRYVADECDVIGMTGFGASAPADVLYREFGITRDAIIARVETVLARQMETAA